MTIAVYAGTFDPFTLGHEDVLNRACQIFDNIIVAVAADTGKKTFFSYEERVLLAREVIGQRPGVEVVGFEGLLSEFVKARSANVLIRGVRNGSDFDYETRMAAVNRALNHDVQTIFSRRLAELRQFLALLSEKFTVWAVMFPPLSVRRYVAH